MKKGLIILFPGIRYSSDAPLLYYTRLAYEYAGYECIAIDDYGIDTKKDKEDLNAYADLAVGNLIRRFKDVDLSEYERVVFAEKSVGTVIGLKLSDELKADDVYHILYTPLDETIGYITPKRRIVGMASGEEDSHVEIKVLASTCKKLGTEFIKVRKAGHRLEGAGDVTKDISVVAQVVSTIGSPDALAKYEKKLAEKEAEEKEKQKKEAEEKEKQKREAEEKEKAKGKTAPKPSENVTTKLRPVKPTNVRRYIPRDTEEVMEIWLLSNMKEQSFIPKKYWNKNFTEIKRVIGLATVYVYEETGKIVGFAASMENVMVGIYVAEDYRSHGIGKVLLDKLKSDMGVLEASVYTKNKRALDFFGREEFTGSAYVKDQATGEDQVLLEW